MIEGMRSVLVLSPHSDDAVIGAGATLHQWANQPEVQPSPEVLVMLFTAGEQTMRNGTKLTADQRISEFRDAMRELGVGSFGLANHGHLYLGDQLDSIPRRTLIEDIDRMIREHDVDTVLLPEPGYNQDHEALYYAGVASCRQGVRVVKRVLVYEDPAAHWMPYQGMVNVYAPMTPAGMKAKMKALEQGGHNATRGPFDPFSMGSIMQWAQMRGREVAVESAEAFHALRWVL